MGSALREDLQDANTDAEREERLRAFVNGIAADVSAGRLVLTAKEIRDLMKVADAVQKKARTGNAPLPFTDLLLKPRSASGRPRAPLSKSPNEHPLGQQRRPPLAAAQPGLAEASLRVVATASTSAGAHVDAHILASFLRHALWESADDEPRIHCVALRPALADLGIRDRSLALPRVARFLQWYEDPELLTGDPPPPLTVEQFAHLVDEVRRLVRLSAGKRTERQLAATPGHSPATPLARGIAWRCCCCVRRPAVETPPPTLPPRSTQYISSDALQGAPPLPPPPLLAPAANPLLRLQGSVEVWTLLDRVHCTESHEMERVPEVRLLRASWLLDKRNPVHPRGGRAGRERLPPRQRLEETCPEAFISADELRALHTAARQSKDAGEHDELLPIVAVAMDWLSADHPDPHGMQLELLVAQLNGRRRQRKGGRVAASTAAGGVDRAAAVDRMLTDGGPGQERESADSGARVAAAEEELALLPSEFGILLPWCSLCQEGGRGGRSPPEQAAFDGAITHIDLWYTHPLTTVVMLHAPRARTAWLAPYPEFGVGGGWPLMERALLLHLGKPTHGTHGRWAQLIDIWPDCVAADVKRASAEPTLVCYAASDRATERVGVERSAGHAACGLGLGLGLGPPSSSVAPPPKPSPAEQPFGADHLAGLALADGAEADTAGGGVTRHGLQLVRARSPGRHVSSGVGADSDRAAEEGGVRGGEDRGGHDGHASATRPRMDRPPRALPPAPEPREAAEPEGAAEPYATPAQADARIASTEAEERTLVREERAARVAAATQRLYNRQTLQEAFRRAVIGGFAGCDDLSMVRVAGWDGEATATLCAMLPFVARAVPSSGAAAASALGNASASNRGQAAAPKSASRDEGRARGGHSPDEGRRPAGRQPGSRSRPARRPWRTRLFGCCLRCCESSRVHAVDEADAHESTGLATPTYSLSRLLLARCYVGDEGAVGLALCARSSAVLCGLRALSLADNRIGDAGMRALAEALALAMPQLTELTLSINRVGDEGMLALAENLSRSSLRYLAILRLDSNRIAHRGACALGRALARGAMGGLRTLDLAGNAIGDSGLTGLLRTGCERGHALMHLMHLDISATHLGTERVGVEAGRTGARLGPPISADHVAAIGKSTTADGTQAEAKAADWSAELGVATLASALAVGYMPVLQTLRLSRNRVGDKGAAALATAARCGGCRQLRELWLCDNRLSAAGVQALAQAIGPDGAFPCLATLALRGNAAGAVSDAEVGSMVNAVAFPPLRGDEESRTAHGAVLTAEEQLVSYHDLNLAPQEPPATERGSGK